jgi:serine/threonine protein kinase
MAGLVKEGPMAPQRALGLLGQVAEALDNLHERGLVHLDVKPANVLVTTRESAGEHIYLADFGLTRRGATGHRTRGGDFLGSPTYAAPEHLRGEPVDGRTDQYSLACVLFACLAGRPPFQGQVPEVIQGHLNREPPPVTEYVPLTPAIDEVIRRGMSKSPTQRYATCRELVAAARAALTTVPRPPPRGPQGTMMAPMGGRPTGHRRQPQRPHQYQPNGPHPVPSQADPVRLRPPVPAGSTAFGAEKSGNRWIAPVLVGAVAITAIVLAVVFLTGDSGGGGGTPETTAPSIQVGPETTGGGAGGSSPSTTRKTLPPSITIIPAP